MRAVQQTQNFPDTYIMFQRYIFFPLEHLQILLPFSMHYYYRYTDFTVKKLVLARTDNKVSIVSWKTAITLLQWVLLFLTVFQKHKAVWNEIPF